jgi:PIN domain nuclease of toxin-antitoxin system
VYLLDTHALVWTIGSPDRLPAAARAAVTSGQAKVSVISLWELILKKRRSTAPVREPLVWWEKHVTRSETEVIPVRVRHLAELDRLANIHTDPFDRMLVAQALAENCTLVSGDGVLARYGAPVVWE